MHFAFSEQLLKIECDFAPCGDSDKQTAILTENERVRSIYNICFFVRFIAHKPF